MAQEQPVLPRDVLDVVQQDPDYQLDEQIGAEEHEAAKVKYSYPRSWTTLIVLRPCAKKVVAPSDSEQLPGPHAVRADGLLPYQHGRG
jgi:hypothetical protein